MILFELIEYDTLRVIWWALLGVLLIGFALTDGFDMGVGALLPFVAKTDVERRVAINTVGPVWEGNQVWFILGGGAIFAAWPPLYAVSFSGFYLAMFVVLAAFIVRPVAFKYRSKRDGAAWRARWDWALFVGGAVPALLFGVAVGNVLLGVPFYLTEDLMPMYPGNAAAKFVGLLRPFALLAGVVSLSMLLMHGAPHILLCGPASDIALKDAPASATAPQPPRDMSPKGLLSKIAALPNAKVEVCAIYLPAKGAQADVLMEGVTVAAPPAMAAAMIASNARVASY